MFDQKEYLKEYKRKNKALLKKKRNEYERMLRLTKNEKYYAKRKEINKNRQRKNKEQITDRYIKRFPEFRGRTPTTQMIELKRIIINLKRKTDEKQRTIRSASKNT